ncbi:canalicular multispecific organic anion transporter 1 [Echria macrotheca]|uniref:Canalicular multispecific organic anion transporter 1 n=1 Tax=Echria macrotheca TaxID=438768 RepID=A0AAJ0B5Y0_9PEZI|nr:canalicular multispecific organic anion transporter 1 [Echria macrotheca]
MTPCPPAGDDQFGPRVDTACRAFDFTLLFEDAVFIALPAALMVLLLPVRIRKLWRTQIMTASYRLAAWKSAAIAVLSVFHLAALALRVQSRSLYTRAAVAAEVLSSAANFGALVLSFLEDQRSVKPSDLLVLYFSASTLLGIPRLRTLWLLPPSDYLVHQAIWTVLLVITAAVAVLECIGKTRYLRPVYKKGLTSEQTSGFWTRSLFVWLLPLFRQGYSTVFLVEDLPEVDNDLKESTAGTELEDAWRRARQLPGQFRLVKATLRGYAWPFLSAVVPRLFLAAFTFCQPFLIQAAVSHLSKDNDDDNSDHERFGQALVGAFALTYLGIAVSRAIYWRQTYRMLAKVRAGLTAKIYRHTVSLKSRDVEDSAAITLMGTDVERIVESLRFVHEVWAAVPEVAIGVWLLARQVSYASIAPLAICAISLAGTSLVAKGFGPAQRDWVACVEKRVSATATMLRNIKSVKMLGLMDHSRRTIEMLRGTEINVSAKFRKLRVWAIMIGNAPTSVAPFVTLAIYALISLSGSQQSLLIAQAFTSLALISLVTEPLLMFCQALPSMTQALSCFERIERFLCVGESPEIQRPESRSCGDPSSLSPLQPQAALMHPAGGQLVEFRQASVSWSPKLDDRPIVLHDISLRIGTGLTAIVGPVGSGKTTLVSTIIGETATVSGSVVSNIASRVAFCSQTPWLVNDTIRRNIVGESDFSQEWFDSAVKYCGLRDELEGLPERDLTIVGNNGSALSGGQRQRVALARAVYSRLPVVVLDDCTSGLDPSASRTILTELFHANGHFRKAGISVIIATHDLRVLPQVDTVVLLNEGRLLDHGSYQEICERRPELIKLQQEEADQYESRGDSSVKAKNLPKMETVQSTVKNSPEGEQDEEPERAVGDASRQKGNWSVYAYYAKKAGKVSIFLWVLSTVIGAVANAYSSLWVDRWTSASEETGNQQLGLYLGIYFFLVSLATLGSLVECWCVSRPSCALSRSHELTMFRVFFINIIKDTAIKLHSDLLKATLGAPFYFFLESDVGSITNRFSQDMNLIDMTLPSQALQFTSGFAWCLAQLLVICVLGKYLAAVVPVLAAVLFTIQRYYLRTSRQLRVLDIEAKAPLYAHFIDTIAGIGTIRAFGWGIPFRNRLSAILDLSQRPFYMLFCVQQWLTLVLDLVAGALAITLVAIALGLTGALGPGALGVALVLTLQFNALLIQTIQSWTKLETSIGAVARVQQFVKCAPQEKGGTSVSSVSWPERGAVELRHLNAAHTPTSVPVLEDVSLTIAAGEKIAVCGPSGSGKTSMVMSLLKMMDLREGQILIDGVDTNTLDGSDLRAHLNVIPQEPFFMPGTLRFNLDPRDHASDMSIEAAVKRVSGSLWEKLSKGSNIDSLGSEFVASELSHGERQLLCLVRALLVPSKIVIFDEAMSSVDENTETVMQHVVESEFIDKTVISVMHRYSHIEWYDRVVVLRDGRIVECDKPRTLLEREGSALRGLYSAAA